MARARNRRSRKRQLRELATTITSINYTPALYRSVTDDIPDFAYVEDPVDERFIAQVQAGNVHVVESYRPQFEHELVDLDLAAWCAGRVGQKDRRSAWANRVRTQGLDHFKGSDPRPIYTVLPGIPTPRRPEVSTAEKYYLLGRMHSLSERGWNYMEIAQELGQDHRFVRHHVGGPMVYWVSRPPAAL